METTLYRYLIKGANWDKLILSDNFIIGLVDLLNKEPLNERIDNRKYGFTHCASFNNIVYGLFIQEFPKKLVHYESKTKKEIVNKSIDCGEYLFIISPNNHEVYFQAKRSPDLPSKAEILKRFSNQLKMVLHKCSKSYDNLIEADEITNRDKIIEIFYHKASVVEELSFYDFDENLIIEQKQVRNGERQKYFNPKEEYQEALEEGAINFAHNIEKASISAKKGENLQKDPITRAMLEGSRDPRKISYRLQSDGNLHIEYSKIPKKVLINAEYDRDTLKQRIGEILHQLQHTDFVENQVNVIKDNDLFNLMEDDND